MDRKKTIYSLIIIFTLILFFGYVYTIYCMFPKIKMVAKRAVFGVSDKAKYLSDLEQIDCDNYDEALALTEKYLEKYPDSKEGLEKKGYYLIETGESEKGVLVYERILELYGHNSTAYNNLGWACIRLDKNTLALYYLDKAVKVNFGVSDLYILVNKADAMYGLNRTDEAIGFFEQAAKLYESTDVIGNRPKDDNTYLYVLSNLGSLYDSEKDEKMAKETYEKAFNYDKTNMSSFRNLMNIYFSYEEYGKADSISTEFLASCDKEDLGDVYRIIADGYEEREDFANAAKNYVLSAGNSEYKAYSYFQAARDYARLNDVENAKKYIDLCIQDDEYFKKEIKNEPILGELYE